MHREAPRGISIGNCFDKMREMPPGIFHSCVTSPPYLGLRSYGGEQAVLDWPVVRYSPVPGVPEIEVPAARCALGLEPEPSAYVGHLVAIFREVRRVLREDGVLWLNLGDSYSGGSRGSYYPDPKMPERTGPRIKSEDSGNLLGIPWRVALALQADGWVLRADVVLRKMIPIPESVTGWLWVRCRRKVASALPATGGYGVEHVVPRRKKHHVPGKGGTYAGTEWEPCPGCSKCERQGGFVLRRGSWRPTRSYEHAFLLARSASYFVDGARALEPTREWKVTPVKGHKRSGQPKRIEEGQARAVRNPRDVLDLPPRPSKLVHSAMMPPDFVTRCLAVGPRAVCAACGAPRVSAAEGGDVPTCGCGAAEARPRVFDPFMGAGTVAAVAEVAGWDWAGCELSEEYAGLLAARLEEVRRMLAPNNAPKAPRPPRLPPGQQGSLFR